MRGGMEPSCKSCSPQRAPPPYIQRQPILLPSRPLTPPPHFDLELTIRRVVVGVLLMVLLLPGFDVAYGLWGQYEGVDRGGLWMLHEMAVGGGGNGTEAFATALQVGRRDLSTPPSS